MLVTWIGKGYLIHAVQFPFPKPLPFRQIVFTTSEYYKLSISIDSVEWVLVVITLPWEHLLCRYQNAWLDSGPYFICWYHLLNCITGTKFVIYLSQSLITYSQSIMCLNKYTNLMLVCCFDVKSLHFMGFGKTKFLHSKWRIVAFLFHFFPSGVLFVVIYDISDQYNICLLQTGEKLRVQQSNLPLRLPVYQIQYCQAVGFDVNVLRW